MNEHILSLSDWPNLNEAETVYIYHGTSRGAAIHIKRDRLMRPSNNGEERAALSFTANLDYAEYYAKAKSSHSPVILRTRLTNKFKLSDRIIKNKGYEYITFDRLNIDNLDVQTSAGWIPMPEWDGLSEKHIVLFENWKHLFNRDLVWENMEYDEKDLYPGYSISYFPKVDPEDEDDDFYFETKEIAEEYADEVLGLFEALPDPIPIYRTIKVRDIADIDLEYPGESWSFEKTSALNFGKHNIGANYLLTAKLAKKDVDWKKTIKAYLDFSGGMTDDDENEIVVDNQEKIQDIVIEQIGGKK